MKILVLKNVWLYGNLLLLHNSNSYHTQKNRSAYACISSLPCTYTADVVLLRSVTEFICEWSYHGVCYNRVVCHHGIQ